MESFKTKPITDFRIVTANGTVIERYKPTGVGKRMGDHLYLHKDYLLPALAILSSKDHILLLSSEATLRYKKWFPLFEFNCARINLLTGSIRFDEAPDFDTAREPHVGKWLLITPDGQSSRGQSNMIWHHKWLWVKDSHKSFYVLASQCWSATYVPLLKSPPKASDRTWKAQLAEVGLK